MRTRLMAILGLMWAVAAPRVTAQAQGPRIEIRNIDSVSDEAFAEYVRTLHFVEDTEAGDRQALLLGRYPDSAHFGPVATISPERYSITGTPAELRRQGKVIARIQTDSIGAQPYPKLGLLPNATTYWWVQLDPTSDTTGRSVFITVAPGGHILQRVSFGLKVKRFHKEYRNIQPLARFIWEPADDGTWGTCNGGCCSKG